MAKIMTLTRSPDDLEEEECTLLEFDFPDELAEAHWESLKSGVVPAPITRLLFRKYPEGVYINSIARGEFGEEDFTELDIEIRVLH